VALLAVAAVLSAGRAAIDRYLSPAEPTAANPPHAAAAVDRWDRRTDSVPLHKPNYASSVNKSTVHSKIELFIMSDDQDECEWVSVSSGTGLPG